MVKVTIEMDGKKVFEQENEFMHRAKELRLRVHLLQSRGTSISNLAFYTL